MISQSSQATFLLKMTMDYPFTVHIGLHHDKMVAFGRLGGQEGGGGGGGEGLITWVCSRGFRGFREAVRMEGGMVGGDQ